MKKINLILVAAMLIASATTVFAKDNIGEQRKINPGGGFAAGCAKSTNIVNIDLNNVRAPILMNGDMFWDLVNDIARYEIPKGSGKTSDFAAAIWVGGKDNSGNLKLAAQTYRQSGSDYWPGPLDTATVSTDANECLKYDRHWKLLRSDVQTFVDHFTGKLTGIYTPPADIISWPGNGDASKNEGHFLAPFHDVNNDGIYDPYSGDYPDFDLSLHPTCGHLFGDQNIWWVFNDEGNIHTETGGAPIGLEVRAQAFCFQTNDEINNCTFYNYTVINRSSSTVNDTWFGAWNDVDLGYAFDDYVGCDVGRGLGYQYNGEAFDPGTFGYGSNPPCIGQAFFEGPLADPNDGIDNNRNGRIDEPGEEIIMSQFVYYSNDFTVTGNPFTATDYYNYLQGIWRDGTPMTYGGNGHGGSVRTDFMFPGTSDPTNWGTGLGKNNGPAEPPWSEETAGDIPGDRRFLQSAGKFTLKPGAVNHITTGLVWARTTSGGPTASIPLMQLADDKAQALFNNCFAITNGPDAPDMAIRELNNELILSIKAGQYSNDSIETNYLEKDPFIRTSTDTAYHFQGYQIFQFANNSVSITDIGNPDKARLVAQCDIKDSITQIVNQVFNPTLNAFVPTDEVDGANLGLQHTFDIKTDAFASGTSATLINHQTYYFTVIAYAYNASEVSIDPLHPNDGHNTPYLSGRRNVFTYTAIPHIPDPQNGGLQLNSSYGDAPMIQRIEGQGNGGLVLDMTQASINEALSNATNYRVNEPIYQSGAGPISVSIYDPVAVGNHDFTVYLQNTSVSSKWYITEMASGFTDSSDQTIVGSSEKIFPQWGIKVNIHQVLAMAGNSAPDSASANNGFLEGTMTFADNNKQWLSGVADVDRSAQNWILAGTDTCVATCPNLPPPPDYSPNDDPAQVYEKVIGGTWAPFRLVSDVGDGPTYNSFPHSLALRLDSLASVDVVITGDKNLWSRSVVIEEESDSTLSEGGAKKGDPRQHASVDKNGLTVAQGGTSNPSDPNASDYISPTGMGWFPGYAVNLETGERLNIMFGEGSYLEADNGKDMLFNPSPNTYSQFGNVLFGGKHYIYVMGKGSVKGAITVAYDNCSLLKTRLDSAVHVGEKSTSKRIIKGNAWRDCMWVSIPLLATGHSLLESDVKIRLRVAKAYRNYNVATTYSPKDINSLGIPYYTFSTTGQEAQTNQTAVAKSALDLINIVPNPYYSYSSYERNQLDNRVKIVNLPNNCTISIFTSSGLLVRRFIRSIPSSTDLTEGVISQAVNNSSANTETSVDWDLKNSSGVPVAGGVYIIHIDAGSLGERVIKWFGVIRPIDLDTF